MTTDLTTDFIPSFDASCFDANLAAYRQPWQTPFVAGRAHWAWPVWADGTEFSAIAILTGDNAPPQCVNVYPLLDPRTLKAMTQYCRQNNMDCTYLTPGDLTAMQITNAADLTAFCANPDAICAWKPAPQKTLELV